MPDKKETWENPGLSTFAVWKFDARGQVRAELVRGHGVVHLTEEERRYNQELAATKEMDFFSNGSLIPVRLIKDSEDAAEIEANPNLKSDDELRAMFDLHWQKFDDDLEGITNQVTLHRLLSLAVELDATRRQHEKIETRLAEVGGSAAVEIEVVGHVGADDSPEAPHTGISLG